MPFAFGCGCACNSNKLNEIQYCINFIKICKIRYYQLLLWFTFPETFKIPHTFSIYSCLCSICHRSKFEHVIYFWLKDDIKIREHAKCKRRLYRLVLNNGVLLFTTNASFNFVNLKYWRTCLQKRNYVGGRVLRPIWKNNWLYFLDKANNTCNRK